MKSKIKASTFLENNFPKDPTIAALAYKKTRFYSFSQREPTEKTSDTITSDICNARAGDKNITKKPDSIHSLNVNPLKRQVIQSLVIFATRAPGIKTLQKNQILFILST